MKKEDKDFKSVPFYIKVSGRLALFTDPSTKGGGEKFTYQVPTYEALRGIVKSIYWKPTLEWVVDSVKVMSPIRMETLGVRTTHDERNKNSRQDRSYYTYLRKPVYYIKCHFEWRDEDRYEVDRNRIKHTDIMKKAIDRGGRRVPFLGTSECMGFVEPITEEEYVNAKTPYEGVNISLGLMFHSFDYSDVVDGGTKGIYTRFTLIDMNDGEIVYPRVDDEDVDFIVHKVNDRSVSRIYVVGENMRTVDEEYKREFGGVDL